MCSSDLSHEAMTAEFTRNPDAIYPKQSMQAVIAESAGSENTEFLNANLLAESFIGNSLYSNMLLMGAAWQRGLIPVSLAALTRAIELNGQDIANNIKAFNLGRIYAWQPKLLSDALSAEEPVSPLTLDELVADRCQRLMAYQNAGLAQRYRTLVDRVAGAEAMLHNSELSEKVAEVYFKLLAYKDEYEVARLYSDSSFLEQLNEQFEGNFKLQFHLSPPLLSPKDSQGKPKKISLGSWMLPAFGMLQHFKFLRGTALDPFGYGADRKLERQLISEFEALVEYALANLSPDNLDTLVSLIALAEKVRGYGHVKADNAARFRREVEQMKYRINNPAEPVRFIDAAASTKRVNKNVD